jgi:hypothetical protein
MSPLSEAASNEKNDTGNTSVGISATPPFLITWAIADTLVLEVSSGLHRTGLVALWKCYL